MVETEFLLIGCITFDIQVKMLYQFVVNSQAVNFKKDGCFKHSCMGLKVFNNAFQVHGDRDWSS